MSIVLMGSTSGSITLSEPAVAGSNTISLPALTGTVVVAGQNSAITAGTAVASTSGTSIDFTGIPSFVKRITVIFASVSGSGASSFLIQLGTSGGVISTGYNSACNSGPAITSTAGFVVGEDTGALIDTGSYIINQVNSTIWAGGGTFFRDSSSTLKSCAGKLTGAGTIDRVRITFVNGTDTFDAGTINIQYE